MNTHIIKIMKCIVDGMSHGEISTPNICLVGAHNILSCPTVQVDLCCINKPMMLETYVKFRLKIGTPLMFRPHIFYQVDASSSPFIIGP